MSFLFFFSTVSVFGLPPGTPFASAPPWGVFRWVLRGLGVALVGGCAWSGAVVSWCCLPFAFTFPAICRHYRVVTCRVANEINSMR